MSNRELEPLKQAIAAAEKANYNKMIDVELQYAKRLHEQLNKIDKLRHAILNLDQKTIAEIRSYGAPPAGVHEVMSATFLLLGVSVKQLKVSNNCLIVCIFCDLSKLLKCSYYIKYYEKKFSHNH